VQDAGKQRPYYGRVLILFAHISRTSGAGMAWFGVDQGALAPNHVQKPGNQANLTLDHA
jgi:hypothetical protein